MVSSTSVSLQRDQPVLQTRSRQNCGRPPWLACDTRGLPHSPDCIMSAFSLPFFHRFSCIASIKVLSERPCARQLQHSTAPSADSQFPQRWRASMLSLHELAVCANSIILHRPA